MVDGKWLAAHPDPYWCLAGRKREEKKKIALAIRRK